jgi:protein-tyrosine phosphatase
VSPRDLNWDGCVNVRDLGGHRTEDGGETQYGRVIRADSVRGLSEAGWRALVDYGVRGIVDLRWAEELAEDPPLEFPMDVTHVSLFGDRTEMSAVDALVAPIKDPAARKRESYIEFLKRFRTNFGRAVSAVAGAPEGGVVVHCAGGVDRTGLTVALLLRVCGVPTRDVAADYAASEQRWAPYIPEWVNDATTEEEREWRTLLARCPPEAMVSVLDELERTHGGVEAYLLGAGADRPSLRRVRERLRG